MTILNIETSTDICSIALSKDGMILHDKVVGNNSEHHSQASEQLGSMVDEAMTILEDRHLKLDAVAVSAGPGSYTGLRIGVSMAKGIAYGSDARLIAIPTLELLCVAPLLSPLQGGVGEEFLLCPMLDARRMEVYAAIYDTSLRVVRAPQADVVDGETYKSFLDEHDIYFFGNGAEKCMPVINHPRAHYLPDIQPLAKNMMPLAEKRFYASQFEDVAYFTPEYLKAYQAKLPKKLL